MITIIGGGIGGLTTALALEKIGQDYQVFERAPALKPVGAGIWLAPNALQVLDWLGLLEEVQKAANTINRILLGQSDMSPLSGSDQQAAIDRFGFSTVAIHRAALMEVLYKNLPAGKVQLGKAFDHFVKLENDKIEVHFTDGDSVITDALLGVDGINSAVRRQLFPEASVRYSGQTCWRGVADYELPEKLTDLGVELWGKGVRFGWSRVMKGKTYWFAVKTSPQNGIDEAEGLSGKLLREYEDFAPLVQDIIRATEPAQIIRGDINDLKPLSAWHRGNILLLGDAGHATTPNMGQGGAQAIEDAYYLARILMKEPLSPDALAKLRKQRWKKVNMIVSQSRQTGNMAHWKYGRGLRNRLMKVLPAKFLEKKMMEVYELD